MFQRKIIVIIEEVCLSPSHLKMVNLKVMNSRNLYSLNRVPSNQRYHHSQSFVYLIDNKWKTYDIRVKVQSLRNLRLASLQWTLSADDKSVTIVDSTSLLESPVFFEWKRCKRGADVWCSPASCERDSVCHRTLLTFWKKLLYILKKKGQTSKILEESRDFMSASESIGFKSTVVVALGVTPVATAE